MLLDANFLFPIKSIASWVLNDWADADGNQYNSTEKRKLNKIVGQFICQASEKCSDSKPGWPLERDFPSHT